MFPHKGFLFSKFLEILSQNVFCFPSLWEYYCKMFFAFRGLGNTITICIFTFRGLGNVISVCIFIFRGLGNAVAKCFLRNEASEKLSQNVFCFLSLWKRCRKMFYRKIIVFCHFSKDFIQKQLFFAIFMRILLRNNCFLPFP